VTAQEDAELAALLEAAWPHRGTPAIRQHVAEIETWNVMRPYVAYLQAELQRAGDIAEGKAA
jgi:hypothetical protein